jgi:hypothetical protein
MTEREAQVALVEHLRYRCAPDATWWAVPNGFNASRASRRRMVEEGLRKGVPDMTFIKKGMQPLFLELKADTTGGVGGCGNKATVSDSQVEMHREIHNSGGRVCIVFGLDEAIAQLEEWGVLMKVAE